MKKIMLQRLLLAVLSAIVAAVLLVWWITADLLPSGTGL